MKNILRILAVLSLALAGPSAQGQTPLDLITGTQSENSTGGSTSEVELRELVRLLSDPALIERLRQRLPEEVERQSSDDYSISRIQQYFHATLVLIENRASAVVHALMTVPRLPWALATAWDEIMAASDFLQSAIYVVVFLFGGFGLEWLYWSYLSATLTRIELSQLKSYGSVLKAAILRAALLFGSIAVFAFGSVGLFIGFEWPPFIEHIVTSLLAGVIIMRVIVMIAVFVLASKVDGLRLLPLDKAAAKNIFTWILAIGGIGLVGYLGSTPSTGWT